MNSIHKINSLFYKVIEYEKQNSPVEKKYNIDSISSNQVLIKISYAGICETDFEVLKGELDYYKSGWAKYPIIPGHEFSGVVSKLGSEITNLKEGDRVVGQCILSCNQCEMCLTGRETACVKRKEVGVLNCNGAYAEYLILPSRFVHKIPNDLSLLTASSIEPLAVVLKGLNRINLNNLTISDKESILIIGAGTIGHLMARILTFWGHEVAIVDSNKQRLHYLSDLNIGTKNKVKNYLKYSHIIECTGNAKSASKVINESAISSNILLMGLPYNKELVDLENIVSYDKKIIGTVGSNAKNFKDAIKMAAKINMRHFDESVYEFDQWKSAWDKHRSKKRLKVKLKIGS